MRYCLTKLLNEVLYKLSSKSNNLIASQELRNEWKTELAREIANKSTTQIS